MRTPNRPSARGSEGLAPAVLRLLAAAAALCSLTPVAVCAPAAGASPAPSPAKTASTAAPSTPWAALEQRCEKCHNVQDWAGGVAFDTLDVNDFAADAETWEKAIRKLRGRLMPPPGQAQPEQADIDSFVHWMENRLDSAAAAHPSPGSVGVHRLNRTEYARQIEAMLGLNIDVKTMLPQDVSSDGFDNIAATLRTSPAFLEQYITAARNISRQAVGRVDAKPSSREFRVPSGLDQLGHVDGLPLGTRGGFVLEHYFPADGEYEFNIRNFFFGGAGYVTKIDHTHHVILTIDDDRVFDRTFGGPEDLRAVDQQQAIAADEMQSRFNHIRVRVKAGEHRVGVTFIARSHAESDSQLQPIAELPEMERTPGIPGVDISGPFNVTGLGDTESRRRIFVCHPASPAEEDPCARRILSHLAVQAFRRPVAEEDLEAPLSFYQNGKSQGDFEAGIEAGLTAILSSTKFLFRADALPQALPASVSNAPVVAPVDDLALASRLSFLMWSEGPDQTLIELASAHKLNSPAALTAQVRRMLADPRSQTLVTNFAFQWLNVNKMDSIEPSPVLYPEFDRNLRVALVEEMRLFLNSVLRSDASVLRLLDSDTTYLNERLALHYGVADVRGNQFRAVRLNDPNRFGLLGKGAVLMGSSYGNRTTPVLRGSYILENIMGTPPTSPPPGVPQFPESEPGKPARTVRERLELHRANPACNACHGVLDPLGFALENFDVTGAWRTRDLDAGTAIDSSGQLSNGTHVSGPVELRHALLARPDQFVQTVTEKLMTFALGRSLRYQDMPAIRAIVRQANQEGDTFEALINGVVLSAPFRMRELPAAGASPKQAALTGPNQRP